MFEAAVLARCRIGALPSWRAPLLARCLYAHPIGLDKLEMLMVSSLTFSSLTWSALALGLKPIRNLGALALAHCVDALALVRVAARLVLRPPFCKTRSRVDIHTTNVSHT